MHSEPINIANEFAKETAKTTVHKEHSSTSLAHVHTPRFSKRINTNWQSALYTASEI